MDLVIGFQKTLQQLSVDIFWNPTLEAILPGRFRIGQGQGDLDFVAKQASVGLQNCNNLVRITLYLCFMGYEEVSSGHNLWR